MKDKEQDGDRAALFYTPRFVGASLELLTRARALYEKVQRTRNLKHFSLHRRFLLINRILR